MNTVNIARDIVYLKEVSLRDLKYIPDLAKEKLQRFKNTTGAMSGALQRVSGNALEKYGTGVKERGVNLNNNLAATTGTKLQRIGRNMASRGTGKEDIYTDRYNNTEKETSRGLNRSLNSRKMVLDAQAKRNFNQ